MAESCWEIGETTEIIFYNSELTFARRAMSVHSLSMRSLRSFAANNKRPSPGRIILAAKERREHKDEDGI